MATLHNKAGAKIIVPDSTVESYTGAGWVLEGAPAPKPKRARKKRAPKKPAES